MRKFSGVTNLLSPGAICSGNLQPAQMMALITNGEYNLKRAGMNIQPYRTEFRNIYK